MGAAAGALASIPTFTPPSSHSHTYILTLAISPSSFSSPSPPPPAPSPLTSPLPSLATSSFRPRRAAPQQPAVNNRPSRHRYHRSGACPSRRTLLHIAPFRAARVAAARPFSRRWRAARARTSRTATASRPFCYTARGASAASAAVSKTLSPAAAAAAASEVLLPAAAAPMRDRRPRL